MKDKINELVAANSELERSGSESLNGSMFFSFAVTVWRKKNKSFICFLWCFVKFSGKSLSVSAWKTYVGEPTPAGQSNTSRR